MKRVIFTLAFVGLFTISVLSQDIKRDRALKQMPPPAKVIPGEVMAEKLALKGKIKQKFLKHMADFHEFKLTQMIKLEKLKLELAELLRETPIYLDKVKAKLREIAHVKQSLIMKKVNFLNKLSKILPDEKYKIVRDLLIERWLKESHHHGIEHGCPCLKRAKMLKKLRKRR